MPKVALVVRVIEACPQQWLKATNSLSVVELSTRTMREAPSSVPTATRREGRREAVFVPWSWFLRHELKQLFANFKFAAGFMGLPETCRAIAAGLSVFQISIYHENRCSSFAGVDQPSSANTAKSTT